eukprot:tig00021795_g23523.t1
MPPLEPAPADPEAVSSPHPVIDRPASPLVTPRPRPVALPAPEVDLKAIDSLKNEVKTLRAQLLERMAPGVKARTEPPAELSERERGLQEAALVAERRVHGAIAAAEQAEAEARALQGRVVELEAALASARAEAERAKEEASLASQRMAQARLAESQARGRAHEAESEAAALRRELKGALVEAQKQVFRTQEAEQALAAARVERAELLARLRSAEGGEAAQLAAIDGMRSACFAQLSVMNEHIRTLTDAVESMSRERWEASSAGGYASTYDRRSPVPSAAPSSPPQAASPPQHSSPPLLAPLPEPPAAAAASLPAAGEPEGPGAGAATAPGAKKKKKKKGKK